MYRSVTSTGMLYTAVRHNSAERECYASGDVVPNTFRPNSRIIIIKIIIIIITKKRI